MIDDHNFLQLPRRPSHTNSNEQKKRIRNVNKRHTAVACGTLLMPRIFTAKSLHCFSFLLSCWERKDITVQ